MVNVNIVKRPDPVSVLSSFLEKCRGNGLRNRWIEIEVVNRTNHSAESSSCEVYGKDVTKPVDPLAVLSLSLYLEGWDDWCSTKISNMLIQMLSIWRCLKKNGKLDQILDGMTEVLVP